MDVLSERYQVAECVSEAYWIVAYWAVMGVSPPVLRQQCDF